MLIMDLPMAFFLPMASLWVEENAVRHIISVENDKKPVISPRGTTYLI